MTCPINFGTITNENFINRTDLLTKTRECTKLWYKGLLRQLDEVKLPMGKALMLKPPELDALIVKHWKENSPKKEAPSVDRRVKLIGALITVGFIERITRACHEKHYDALRTYVSDMKQKYQASRVAKLATDNKTADINLVQLVKAVIDAPKELHMEKAIVGMYCLLPPARLDYESAIIYTREPPAASLARGNHIIISRKPRVVLNEYKTDAKFGQLINVIPENLKAILKESLKIFPRQYLYGELPLKESQSTSIISAASLKLTGKRLSATDLRHIYASSADISNMTTAEYTEFARRMGHGPMTSLTKYRTSPELAGKKT